MSGMEDLEPGPLPGERCNHAWDEHGACQNCAAIDARKADDWRPPYRTPDGQPLVEMPDWARNGG